MSLVKGYIPPEEDRRLRQACLGFSITLAGDPVANARRFYAFVTEERPTPPRERSDQVAEGGPVT